MAAPPPSAGALVNNTHVPTGLPGISSAIGRVNRRLHELAEGRAPVLLLGEPGTEKSFAAKIMHRLSGADDRPLVRVSISWKLPPDIAQYFVRCKGGSLLVQLQRDIPVDIQYTLLEIANHGSFADPLSGEMVESDARVFLLHSRPFDRLIEETPLLPELRELLSSSRVEIPPLRDRPEDIPALVRYAITRAVESGRSAVTGANPQVLRLFRQWHWPGNAEDLLLVTAQAALSAREGTLAIEHLPETFLARIPEAALEAARAVPVPDSRPAGRTAKPFAPAQRGPHPHPATAGAIPPETRAAAPASRAAAGPAASEPIPPIPTGAPPDDAQGQADLPPRVQQLLERLNAQAELLSRQLAGGQRTPPAPFTLDLHREERTARELAWAQLEERLDRGVDRVLSLRRRMAAINMRRRNAVEGLKDLLQRLARGAGSGPGFDPAASATEAEDLIRQLDDMESMIEEVSARLPSVIQKEAGEQPSRQG